MRYTWETVLGPFITKQIIATILVESLFLAIKYLDFLFSKASVGILQINLYFFSYNSALVNSRSIKYSHADSQTSTDLTNKTKWIDKLISSFF